MMDLGGGVKPIWALDREAADLALRASMRELQRELDDYVLTAEVERWVSQYERVRTRKSPKEPASEQALWRMVRRVCERAGVRELSPHQLRHGFANRFLRESGRDVAALRQLPATLVSTRRTSTPMKSSSTSSPMRWSGLTASARHKRRPISRRSMQKSQLR